MHLRFIRAWLSRFNRTPMPVIVRVARINSMESVTGRRKLLIIEYQTAAVSGQLARVRVMLFASEISLVAHNKHARKFVRGNVDGRIRIAILPSYLQSFFSHTVASRIWMNFRRIASSTLIYGTARTDEKSKITPEVLPFPSTRWRVNAPPLRFVDR